MTPKQVKRIVWTVYKCRNLIYLTCSTSSQAPVHSVVCLNTRTTEAVPQEFLLKCFTCDMLMSCTLGHPSRPHFNRCAPMTSHPARMPAKRTCSQGVAPFLRSAVSAVESWGPWFLWALFAAILVWEEVWDLPNTAYLSAGLLLLITAGDPSPPPCPTSLFRCGCQPTSPPGCSSSSLQMTPLIHRPQHLCIRCGF